MRYLAAAIVALSLDAGTAAAEWSPWERITGILVHNDSLEVTITGPGTGCERVYRLGTLEPNYDVKATATLSAFYAGHRISIDWSGSKQSCATPFHRIKVRP